jgi:hypothetical protein
VAKLPGGSRTFKPLGTLYAEEDLPDLAPLAPGEQRIQHHPEVAAFVASLAQPQVRPRRTSTTNTPPPEDARTTSQPTVQQPPTVGLHSIATVKSAARTAPLRSAPAAAGKPASFKAAG